MTTWRRTRTAFSAWLAFGALPLWGQAPDPLCLAPESGLRLDHVPIAVGDIAALADRLTTGFGFSLKPGRPHPNGLENIHIRFADGSALELMTVGQPGDAVARRYADLISDGGGGAYLALSGPSVDEVMSIAREIEPALEVTRSGAFDWASFPGGHALSALFFVEVHQRPPDLPEHVAHRNGAEALEAVWVAVEDPDRLTRFLLAFGGRDCGMSRHPEHLYGRAVGLARGIVYIVDAGLWEADPESAPIISLTVASSEGATPDNIILGEAGGLWIELRPRSKP